MLKRRIPQSILIYSLICIFGIGSWTAVNGLWAEISILVITTPECEKLPAVLAVIIQVANVGPLVYTLVKYLFYRCKWKSYLLHLEIGTIVILILTGISSCIFLSLFWNRTSTVFNSVHSVSLFILTFFLALVDCTSSVVFIPFMKHFPAEYLSALYIGEGLSGLLPSLFALSQGSVNNTISCSGDYTGHEVLGIQFSPSVYFIFLGGMMSLCGISFITILTIPSVRKHIIANNSKRHTCQSANNETVQRDQVYEGKSKETDEGDNGSLLGSKEQIEELHRNENGGGDDDSLQQVEEKLFEAGALGSKEQMEEKLLPRYKLHFSVTDVCKMMCSNATIYICLSVLSFLTNGALGAISPFAFLHYGNSVYHIAINLALLANPFMCLFFAVFPSKSKVITVITTVIICIFGIYVLVMAQSTFQAHDTFQAHEVGKILIVSI